MKFFTGSLPARPSLRIRRAAASHRVDPTHGRALRSAGLFPAGRASLAVLASLAIALQASAVKSASSKPPLSPDADAAAVASSTVSATLEFGLEALDRALERNVPKRIATFKDRVTSCWHRRFLRREVNIECVYSGYVERTGGVSLRAEGGRLSTAAPLFGTVSAQGIRGLGRLLHGTAEGQMTVYASARPQLRPDWSVALDMSEGFRWAAPPTLTILGFRINLERYVDPRIRSELERVQADVAAHIRALDIRRKAEAVWQRAFATVKICEQPEIWLRSTPQSIAFSGIRVEREILQGSAEIAGTTETMVGSEPGAQTPTPLPRLGRDVSEPGRFEIIVPVNIDYGMIRQKVRDILATRAENAGPALRDVAIYPSDGKIVVGLRLAAPNASAGEGDWIYLTATPQINADAQVVQFPDLALIDDGANSVAVLVKDSGFLSALQERLRIDYQAERDRIIASANERLSRPLGNGLRSEGRISSAGVAEVLLLASDLRLDLRASGRLKILFGL
jgi:Domain of unknown function (DUF4403)